jgi:hypothetical protein
MSPSMEAVRRTRYWVVVVLRVVAALLVIAAVVGMWKLVARTVEYELWQRQGRNTMLRWSLPVSLLLSQGPFLLAAAALVRWETTVARWLVPMPRAGCPECGYAMTTGPGARCPECGLAAGGGTN